MAYRLKKQDRTVGRAVRRIADEQIGKALAAIDVLPLPEAIHDVRKRCKKLRGLIRLVRPAFEAYAIENAAFRGAAGQISGARDAAVMRHTWDLLRRESAGPDGAPAIDLFPSGLDRQNVSDAAVEDLAQGLADVRLRLVDARRRAAAWEITGDGWKSVGKGLKMTYARAQDAAAQTRSSPGGARFHELRKQAKYHWHHCRLLQDLWPDLMRQRKRAVFGLSEILGEYHDLEVLIEALAAAPGSFAAPDNVDAAIHLSRERQSRLAEQAWPMIDSLFSQSPRELGRHLAPLWAAWWEHG